MSVSELPLTAGRIDSRRLLGRLFTALVVGALVASGPLLLRGAIAGNHGAFFYDFRGGLYNAGWAILHGRSFYEPGFLAHQAAIMNAGGIARGELYTNPFSIPVYPAFANVAVVPLALLPFTASALLYTGLSIAAMIASLWLLDVRDVRCHAAALVSWPFLYGAYLGAIGPWLVLGTAALWRWRDRAWPAAVALATIVAAKIFPWTLGVWLWITGRRRAAICAVIAGAALTLGAWAIIGFSGLIEYPRMLNEMSALQEGRAVSVATVLVVAGASSTLATAAVLALGGALLALAARFARRPGGERPAFGLAVIAALTATPIVWEHYLVLLFVPIALACPRFSRLWLVPLAMPLIESLSTAVIPDSPRLVPDSPNALREAILALALEAVVAVWLCTTPEQRRGVLARVRPGRLAAGSPGSS